MDCKYRAEEADLNGRSHSDLITSCISVRGKCQLSNTTFIATVDVFPCIEQKLSPD